MGRVVSSLFPIDVCRFRNRCRRLTQLRVALSFKAPLVQKPAGLFCVSPLQHCRANIYHTPPSPYSNPFAVEDTRRLGGPWHLRGGTICLDVRILGCCFSLCGAGARQLSNSIEERVNPSAKGWHTSAE